MSLTGGLMIFAILWWMVLFTVLPFGIRTSNEAGIDEVDGQAASAPVRPRIITKMVITTLISAAIMGLIVAFVEAEIFDFWAYFTSGG